MPASAPDDDGARPAVDLASEPVPDSLAPAPDEATADALAQVTEEPRPATIGRPRDPELERRAMIAALDIYGRLGWSGFTFSKVAAQARIGKSSIYRRWSTTTELLLDAFDETDAFYSRHLGELEHLPFALRVRAIVRHRVGSYFSPTGLAVIRLNVENQANPGEVGEMWRRSIGRAVLRTRELIQEAIVSGDLRGDTSMVHLGDALEGAMVMHALATPTHLRERAIAQLDTYASELVDRLVTPWLTEEGLRACDFCRTPRTDLTPVRVLG